MAASMFAVLFVVIIFSLAEFMITYFEKVVVNPANPLQIGMI
jgi:hypothetical protein